MGVIIRQSIKGTLVTYIGAGIGILTNLLIITRYLGAEVIGFTRLLFETGSALSILFQLGASFSAMHFFPYFKSEDKNNNGFFFYLISLVSIGFLIFIPIFLIFKDPITHYFAEGVPLFNEYYYWIIPLTFFILYWITFELYANILMRIAIPKLIREIILRLFMIGLYVLYGTGYLNLNEFIFVYIGIYGIMMTMTFIYVARIGSISLKHDPDFITPVLKKDFSRYTSFFIIGSLGAVFAKIIDLVMIGGEMNTYWVGIYTISLFMVTLLEMPSRSITTISAPIASAALKEGDTQTAGLLYKKVSLHQLLIGCFLFILLWINIDNIYAIIPNGEIYRPGKWPVLFLGLAKLIEITIGFGITLISYSKYYKWNLVFTFFILFSMIMLNRLLIPELGISGAAIATLATYMIAYGLLLQLIVWIKLKVHPYHSGTLKIASVALTALLLNHFLPTLANPWIDGIYRTLLIGSLSGCSIYFFKISPETNALIQSLLEKIKHPRTGQH